MSSPGPGPARIPLLETGFQGDCPEFTSSEQSRVTEWQEEKGLSFFTSHGTCLSVFTDPEHRAWQTGQSLNINSTKLGLLAPPLIHRQRHSGSNFNDCVLVCA